MVNIEREAWEVICRPMLIDSQRPEYCPCVDEETHPACPLCPATVEGNDIVGGVCQALKSGPAPHPLIELVVIRRSDDFHSDECLAAATND